MIDRLLIERPVKRLEGRRGVKVGLFETPLHAPLTTQIGWRCK